MMDTTLGVFIAHWYFVYSKVFVDCIYGKWGEYSRCGSPFALSISFNFSQASFQLSPSPPRTE